MGDTIEKEQVIGKLEDGLARAEVRIKEAKLRAAEEDWWASVKTRDEANQRWQTYKQLLAQRMAVSLEYLRDRELTFYRSVYEANSQKEAVQVAEEEFNQATTILESFHIRSGVRGIIRRIHKRPGEAAHSLETVVTLELLDDDEG